MAKIDSIKRQRTRGIKSPIPRGTLSASLQRSEEWAVTYMCSASRNRVCSSGLHLLRSCFGFFPAADAATGISPLLSIFTLKVQMLHKKRQVYRSNQIDL